MYAMSSCCFVFSWAAATAGGGRVVAGKGRKQTSAMGRFPQHAITNTSNATWNYAEVLCVVIRMFSF
jgi:hypothetical protein